jgi:hypothetical protein
MSQYILFFSKKCKYSIQFINIIHKVHLRNYFTFISVDQNKDRTRDTSVAKFNITHVPTIIINDQKLVGQQALLWLRDAVSDMGLKSPHSMDSRQQKETFEETPRYIEEQQEELSGYNPDDSNFVNIDTNLDDTRIHYQPEDGQTHRNKGEFGLESPSILPPEEARKFDINIYKTKTNSGSTGRTGLKKDTLKTKQYNSEYERYLQERESEIPQQRRRM